MFRKLLSVGSGVAVVALTTCGCAANTASENAVSQSPQSQVAFTSNQGQYPAPRYSATPVEAPYALTGEESQDQATQWVPADRQINVGNARILVPPTP